MLLQPRPRLNDTRDDGRGMKLSIVSRPSSVVEREVIMEEDKDKRIIELEEKIRRLEDELSMVKTQKTKEEKEEGTSGVAEGILKGLGKMIPGLGNLIEEASKSPAFKDKLKEINKEVEKKFKEGVLKPGGSGTGVYKHPRGMRDIRTAPYRPPVAKKVEKPSKEKAEKVEKPPALKPRELMVDVFDEIDHLKIVSEIPGVKEEDIKIDLKGNILTISIDVPGRECYKEVELPCEPKGEMEKTYKNGILEVILKKDR